MIILVDKQARKRELSKKWRLNNPEKVKKMKRNYEDNHRESINAYYRAYRLRHQKPQSLKEQTDKDQ